MPAWRSDTVRLPVFGNVNLFEESMIYASDHQSPKQKGDAIKILQNAGSSLFVNVPRQKTPEISIRKWLIQKTKEAGSQP